MKSLFLTLLLTTVIYAQPWVPEVIWQRAGMASESNYGMAILPLGDQNDDGLADFGIYQLGGGDDLSRIELFHGGNPIPQEPYLVVNPDSSHHLLFHAQVLGDINGDGYTDWCVDVHSPYDPDFYGYTWWFFGGPGQDSEPDVVYHYTDGLQRFTGIGDFNGDHFDDLLYSDDWNEGNAVFFGGNPLDTLPDLGIQWGWLGGSGDLNGDSYSDLIFELESGNWTIYLGSARPDSFPDYIWEFPDTPHPVKDLNDDSFADLVSSIGNGTINVRFGSQTIDSTIDATLSFVPFNVPTRIFSAGDLNHDGYNDLIALDSYELWGSYVTVHFGGAWINPQPQLVLDCWDAPFGGVPFETAAGLGDVDGDGVDDFAVSTLEHPMDDRGTVFIYGGVRLEADDPPTAIPQDFTVDVFPNPFNAATTLRFEVPLGASRLAMSVFNTVGQEVYQTEISANTQTIEFHFEGKDRWGIPLSSGIYFLRSSFGQLNTMTKLVVLK